MPIGAWSPPTPEYLTAPGYTTYAPTRAYAYTPTGGDWSGTYPSYGGGGGGGLTSGDFEGGTDTSTLGGLLTAASVLGGANNLSSLITGKGLLEHAGIPNPFSNFFGGGDGLSFTDMLPNEYFGGLKNALNIYPSQGGLLTPGGGTALLTDAQGTAMGEALGGTEGYFSTAMPQDVFWSDAGPWATPGGGAADGASLAVNTGNVNPQYLGQNMLPRFDVPPAYGALEGAKVPKLGDIFMGPPPPDLGIPNAWGEVVSSAGPQVVQAPPPAAPINMAQSYSGTAATRAGVDAANTIAEAQALHDAAIAQQALQDLGGIQATGYGATPTMAQQATMDLGGIGATGFGAAPAIGAAYLGAPMSGYASGALTGGALGGPGAAAGLNAGFMAPLGLAFYGMSRMAEDPTADPRMANQLENYFQRALQGPEQEALELENLKQQVFLNPASIEVMKRAAEGGVPGAVHRSGGADIVGWPEPVSAKFREFLPELERVAAESGLAHHGGMYNIGDYGQMGSPPIPYGENRKPVVIDQAYDAGSYSDASRREQRFYPDMFQAP